MRAGRLNQRITIKAKSAAQDAAGEMVPTWTTFATVWASINDISGKEYVSASATQNAVTTKIGIRYLAGVVASMRVEHGSDVYNIEAVLGQDKKSLLLMCSRGAGS